MLTAEEREKRDEERKETIRQYRAWRASVLRSRDEDRQFRNSEKIRQLQEAEKQQVTIGSLSSFRETFSIVYVVGLFL